jgi:hypothetical protein
MQTYTFTITLARVAELTVEVADALFEAGCDDASPGSSQGVVMLDFSREAESLGDAVGSAIAAVERAGHAVARVEVRGLEEG